MEEATGASLSWGPLTKMSSPLTLDPATCYAPAHFFLATAPQSPFPVRSFSIMGITQLNVSLYFVCCFIPKSSLSNWFLRTLGQRHHLLPGNYSITYRRESCEPLKPNSNCSLFV